MRWNRKAVLLAVLAIAPVPARAVPVSFAFQASLGTGPLAGTMFGGAGSYDTAGTTGQGTEYVSLTALNFTLLGAAFTRSGISQGGQAILRNGALQYFTAAYFPMPPTPVSDIAFGFGGPGIIGYIDQGVFGDGAYSFVAASTPEPGSFLLVAAGLIGLAGLRRNPR